jgi:hypothetical protein
LPRRQRGAGLKTTLSHSFSRRARIVNPKQVFRVVVSAAMQHTARLPLKDEYAASH